MGSESKETWFLDIVEKLDDFCKRVDGNIKCKLISNSIVRNFAKVLFSS